MDQALEGFAVTFAQYRALEAIESLPHMHASYLARKLRLKRQATHAVVKKLLRAGYVTIEDEGYVKTMEITELGRRHLRLFRDSAVRIPRVLEDALDLDERASLHALLTKADRALDPPRRPNWWLDRPDGVSAWMREADPNAAIDVDLPLTPGGSPDGPSPRRAP